MGGTTGEDSRKVVVIVAGWEMSEVHELERSVAAKSLEAFAVYGVDSVAFFEDYKIL